MADLPDAAQDVNWGSIVTDVLAEVFKNDNISFDGLRGLLVAASAQGQGVKLKTLFLVLTWFAGQIGKLVADGEELVMPAMAAFIAPIVGNMFGAEVSVDAFTSRANSGQRNAAAQAVVDAFLSAITDGAAEPIEPSEDGARRLATAGVHAALEGWLMAAVPELVTDFAGDFFHPLDAFGRLPDEVIGALGISRLVRRALQPLVNATAAEPMRWAANYKYRPTKLGASTIARELARGRWTLDQAQSALAFEGYKDEFIDAILNEVAKFRSAPELELLARMGAIPRDAAIEELQSAGWTAEIAPSLIDIERFKRIERFEHEMATAAVAAYAEGRIDAATLDPFTHGVSIDDQGSAQLRELADAKRALRALHLTPAEAKACVEAAILPMSEYTDALTRAGYVPDAIDALEMLLRKQIDAKRTAAEVRQATQEARAAAAKVRADAAAAKATEIAAGRALKRRGSLATLEDAVVRGLIPVSRLEEVLSVDFDPDTVGIYVADVESKRQARLAKQAAAGSATKRAAVKGLSVGQLQTALTDGVLTIDEVTRQLTAHGLNDADVAVLRETMADTATAHQKAAAIRAAAQQRSQDKPLTLAEANALAVAGHWTLADYNAYLATLGHDEADIANLDALLEDQIAKHAKAHALHAAAAKTSGAKGLTLAQWRSAVVLGLKSTTEFAGWLTTEGYNADAVSTLIAEVEAAAQAADAARARRTGSTGASDGRAASLADVTRAARLGLLTPAEYQAELTARDFSPAGVALELELLQHEIAAAGGTGTAPGAATVAKATAKHVQVDGELAARALSLATVEKAVVDELTTLDQYQAWLEANGYGTGDAELLRALLTLKLSKK